MLTVSSFRDYIYSKLQCFLIKEHKNRKFIFLILKFIAEKACLRRKVIRLVLIPVLIDVSDYPEGPIKEKKHGEDHFNFFGEVTEPGAEKEVKPQEEK